MEIVADTLILLVVLQTALRLSQWRNNWLKMAFCIVVGIVVWLMTDYAVNLSKPQVEGWLHDTTRCSAVCAGIRACSSCQ